jgi:hypothetical protein
MDSRRTLVLVIAVLALWRSQKCLEHDHFRAKKAIRSRRVGDQEPAG